MVIMHIRTLAIAVFLSVVLILISGCAGKTPLNIDIKIVGDSILNARESIALARSEEAEKYAAHELNHAESLLLLAQEALRKGKKPGCC